MARRIFGDTDRASGVPDRTSSSNPPDRPDRCETLGSVEGQALADAFGVWDAQAQEWLPYAPLLLRFEDTDLLLQPSVDGTRVHAALGSVPTTLPLRLARPETAEQERLNQELCLQWMRCSDLSGLAGQRAVFARLLTDGGQTFAAIDFEDGDALVVRNDQAFLETLLVERVAATQRLA